MDMKGRTSGVRITPRSLIWAGILVLVVGAVIWMTGQMNDATCWGDDSSCDEITRFRTVLGIVVMVAGFGLLLAGLLASSMRADTDRRGRDFEAKQPAQQRHDGHTRPKYQSEQTANVVAQLSKLAELKAAGAIEEEEFERLKAKLISDD